MAQIIPIRGAGGGGKGGGGGAHTPVEAPDSLRSISYARLLHLLCEGEIEGPPDGNILNSVYINGTRLLNDDGSYNFSDVTVDFRSGTQSQDPISGVSAAESEEEVGIEVTALTPLVRTITKENADSVRVTIGVPQLTVQDATTGDINGTAVEIAIDIQSNGGGFVQVKDDTISGKTTTRYERSYVLPLTGSGPWDVRVRRVTPDSDQSILVNKTFWDSYTEIISAKLSYPNSSLSSIIIDAQQFSNIPTFGFDLKLLRIQVPSNYDPISRTYAGTWDGTFKIAWSDNPAWCFYDLLTTERYGLGQFIDASQVDKWALYSIGQYCDVMVPDGMGGLEPRYTCHLYLQTQAQAYQVLQDMASVFRGMAFWSSGAITAIQDAPADPTAQYTASNVTDGLFTYSGSALQTRHTAVLVTWNDPANLYKQRVEYVEDADGIARYGVVVTQIVATGCTSRGQAHRVGRWLLYTEINETEAVTHNVGLEGSLTRPGAVMQVQDPKRAGARLGGRIISATTSAITVDQNITLDPAQTYTLFSVLPNGTLATSPISSITGGNIIHLPTALAAAPQAGAIWVVSSTDIKPQLFRCTSVVENSGKFEISGITYNPSKYANIEQGLVLENSPISILNAVPESPINIVVTENLYQSNSDILNMASIGWSMRTPAAQYETSYRRDDGNFIILPPTNVMHVEIPNAIPGLYTIKIVAISGIGKRSQPAQIQQQIYGKLAPPSNVQNFSIIPSTNKTCQASWSPATDLDVQQGGQVWIRFTPLLTGAVWSNATDLKLEPGSSTGVQLPLQTGTYMAKFIDSSGNSSNNEMLVITDVADLDGLNVVLTQDEDPSFTGTMINMAYDPILGGIKLDSALTISQMPGNISTWPLLSTLGGLSTSGSYAFSLQDLQGVYSCKISNFLTVLAFNPSDTIGSRGLVSLWPSITGALIDDVSAQLFIQTTQDDPAGSPTYTDLQPFLSGEFTLRHAKCVLAVSSSNPVHNLMASGLSVQTDMPDRNESINALTSSAAGTVHVAYQYPFIAVPPSPAITANNLSSGDYWVISNESAAGFDIVFKNSSNVSVVRTFGYVVQGVGKKVA